MIHAADNTHTKKPNDIITERILDALNRGIIPWKRPWEALEVMSVDGRPYRGINRLLLSWAGFSDSRFITFRKCAELGGSIRKGEHGFPVVLWNSRKVNVHQKDDKGNEITVAKQIPFMRYYYVFNVEQCENILGKLKPLSLPTSDFHPIDAAQRVVEDYTNRPKIMHGGNEAYYSPMTDTVRLPSPKSFHNPEDYYAAAFHELVHSTGHETRLSRDTKNVFGSEDYSKEELIAEIGSAFLCAEAHIDSPELDKNTIAYIQSWIQVLKNDPNIVIRAAGKAQKAADYILGRQAALDEPLENEHEAVCAA
jgi:antirestriction protein ArdC